MMKCVFALVLLHLCHSAVSSGLYTEMKHNVQRLIGSKPAFQPGANLTVPGEYMLNHPVSCTSPFKAGLKNLLDSLSTESESNPVKTLRKQLKTLEGQNNTNCTMETGHPASALKRYKMFLLKLNNGRGQ